MTSLRDKKCESLLSQADKIAKLKSFISLVINASLMNFFLNKVSYFILLF